MIFRILKSKERYLIPQSSVATWTRAGTASLLRIATVLFPCRLGRVASLLLSKLEGLDRRVTYVWRSLKGLRSATTGLHTIIIIGIEPLGRFGQRPELNQATGIALVRSILGKFLGVGCHYFPPLFRRSHFRHQVPTHPS